MILSIPGGALFLPSTVRHHETHTWYGTSATTFFSDRFSWGYVCANDLGLERYYSTVLPRLPMSTKRQLEAKLVWEAQNLRSFHADAWTTGYNIIWKNLYCKRFEKNQEKTVFDFWNKTQIWTCWFLHRIFFWGGLRDCLLGCYLQGTNPTESKKIQVQPGLPGCLGSSKLMMCQMVWVEIIVGPAVKRY